MSEYWERGVNTAEVAATRCQVNVGPSPTHPREKSLWQNTDHSTVSSTEKDLPPDKPTNKPLTKLNSMHTDVVDLHSGACSFHCCILLHQ